MPVFHDTIEQGSEAWKTMRRSHITATDIGVIMGISEYTSPYQLWQRKLELIPDVEENDAMRRGKALEPEALEIYCSLTGFDMQPRILTSTQYPFAMASLDGIDPSANHICEIKCMGKKNHDEAMAGDVKQLYNYQMQWQMLVAGLTQCDYFVYSEDSHKIITVYKDLPLLAQMIVKAKEFLEMLRTITPPPFTDLDYDDKTDDAHWDSLMASYALYDGLEKDGKIGKEHIKQLLVEYANGRNVRGSNSKFTKVTTKGRIQYDKIEILKEIDLEQYRSEPIESYRITLTKE